MDSGRSSASLTVSLTGLGIVITLLITDAQRSGASLWTQPWFPPLFVLASTIALLGAYAAASPYTGWPMPLTAAERKHRQAIAEARKLEESWQLRDALQEFSDELDNIARRLKKELDSGLMSTSQHPANAWEKYRHTINRPDLLPARWRAQEAYERTNTLNEEMLERANWADERDPNWRRLTDQERQDRQDAYDAALIARVAFEAALLGPWDDNPS